MLISERIYQYMEEKGISQKEFADRTGISQSTVSDWKRKGTNPSADKIMNICEVLDISPYELLSGTENGKMKDYKEKEMIKRIHRFVRYMNGWRKTRRISKIVSIILYSKGNRNG